MTELSSETVHATAVAIDGNAVLILGPSGSGKSDLALRLCDRGAILVGDDYCHIVRRDAEIFAGAPERLRGKIELRGIGICETGFLSQAPVRLLVRLIPHYERFPLDQQRETILGIALPIIRMNASEASAPIKVEWALRRELAALAHQAHPQTAKRFASL